MINLLFLIAIYTWWNWQPWTRCGSDEKLFNSIYGQTSIKKSSLNGHPVLSGQFPKSRIKSHINHTNVTFIKQTTLLSGCGHLDRCKTIPNSCIKRSGITSYTWIYYQKFRGHFTALSLKYSVAHWRSFFFRKTMSWLVLVAQ